MNRLHVTTKKSLREGIEEPPSECFVCGHKTMFLDYVGESCDTCGADTVWESQAGFIRAIRDKAGISRGRLAESLGYKKETIERYEWTCPSNIYRKKFYDHIRGFYNEGSS